MSIKNIAILGSTGSIGTQALDVIRANPAKFRVQLLTAQNNAGLLIAQALEFKPKAVVIGNETHYGRVNDALQAHGIKVYTGEYPVEGIVGYESVDTVLTAMVGFSGLKPTLSAIRAGKSIALANKETLVVGGHLIMNEAQKAGINIYPVDSEHSAIFQCLVGEFHNPIEKIYLTASGGPFRGKNRDQLKNVRKEEALKHPNWDMGCKITIDSASLMNKGLEVIEAYWLFGLRPEQIKVIVHPQSIIHSIVQFEDGSMKAQMGLPDMKLPIQYALAFPQRLKSNFARFNFIDYPQLTFEQPDLETFRNLGLAYYAMEKGGNTPCILNAANEVAVAAFLKDKTGFLEMSEVIEKCLQKITFIANPTLEDLCHTDKETRILAGEIIYGESQVYNKPCY